MKFKRKKLLLLLFLAIFLIAGFNIISKNIYRILKTEYDKQASILIFDRNDKMILLKPNISGYYANYAVVIPDNFKQQLLAKEDKYFYSHPGINPFSIARALKNYFLHSRNPSSSTITQQLVKILLNREQERTLKNKIIEAFYAIGLEAQTNKEEILLMYANSVFFGNQAKGINAASRLYFDLNPDELADEQSKMLVDAISNPNNKNPFKISALDMAEIKNLKLNFQKYYNSGSAFEFQNAGKTGKLSIDGKLTENLRNILKNNLQILLAHNASNGSIVVIKLPENELLAIAGSPDPAIDNYGYKINMALKPRPIGSTVKPFIYLKGFEKNLRPYTLVEDKEYKYTIGSGFSFYPKNYDYEYRGEVDLHYALANSLNVPTVKVLEYIGIENFNNFLLNDLEFAPVQSLDNYQLGIALGELEMDLLSLSYYFSIFPNEGVLMPLEISRDDRLGVEELFNVKNNFSLDKKISHPAFIQLVNKILSDRKTGVEQFGEKSDLNLFSKNYAVKTGTSREFHDSWAIGYTPDFIVGVWVGNSDDSPMENISGLGGAGRIWQEAMNLLLNSEYNKNTKFNFDLVKDFQEKDNLVYGLNGDDFENYKNLLENNNLILNPHNGDTFFLEKNTQIPLKAREDVEWFIGGKLFGKGEEIIFQPQDVGEYKIEADLGGKKEAVVIFIED